MQLPVEVIPLFIIFVIGVISRSKSPTITKLKRASYAWGFKNSPRNPDHPDHDPNFNANIKVVRKFY
jgi:hypothetical protein